MTSMSGKLRDAMLRLRKVTEEARCQCGGPVCGPDKWFRSDELEVRFDGSEGAIPLILTMSPTVATTLAEWLDCESALLDGQERYPDLHTRPNLARVALMEAVADAILGGYEP